jgi:hypothetical protein
MAFQSTRSLRTPVTKAIKDAKRASTQLAKHQVEDDSDSGSDSDTTIENDQESAPSTTSTSRTIQAGTPDDDYTLEGRLIYFARDRKLLLFRLLGVIKSTFPSWCTGNDSKTYLRLFQDFY